MRKRTTKNIKFTKSCGNLFEDMGFQSAQAIDLQMKSMLMNKLIKIIQKNKWSSKKAAAALGVAACTISFLLHGRINMLSMRKLTKMLHSAGYTVAIKMTKEKE